MQPASQSNRVAPQTEIDPSALEGGSFFSYTPTLPAILFERKLTLAISTYQAGKLIFASSINGKNMRLFGKSLPRPMGIAIDGNKMAVAGKYTIEVYAKSRGLATSYPADKKQFDSIYFPQASYHTGFTDMHDLAWGKQGLWAVNTAFSCLATMDEGYHFVPKWHPPFITELTPEDRCHLNGLAMSDGHPSYVTMLGQSNTKEGWRGTHHEKGLIMDVRNNDVILQDLPMPHSPRVHEGSLYFLLSAIGKLMKYDLMTKELTELCNTRSFIRGLDLMDGLAFVGTSTIRQSSRAFADLPVSKEQPLAGVKILDLASGDELANLTFSDRVHETFDVKIIPGIIRPTILTMGDDQAYQGLMLPNGRNFWTREITKE
jgi:uncharacterized protein (TIGR03032 family)